MLEVLKIVEVKFLVLAPLEYVADRRGLIPTRETPFWRAVSHLGFPRRAGRVGMVEGWTLKNGRRCVTSGGC